MPDGEELPANAQSAAAQGRPVILLVQAEAVQAMALGCLLDGAGYGVLTAPDAEAALRMMDTTPLVAAIVDLTIQDGAGRPMVERLRRRMPGLPVVVITAFGPLAPQADLRGLGGPTVRVTKPYDAEYLLARLATAIESGSGVAE